MMFAKRFKMPSASLWASLAERFFIERKPENLRIFRLSLFTGKVVEINGILPLSACGRRAAEKMHLTDTARSVKKQFRNDRSRFGTANYKNNISAVYGAAHAEPF